MRIEKITLFLIGILLFMVSCRPHADTTSLLEVIGVDVGQGSCVLLRSSEGDVLIDAGNEIRVLEYDLDEIEVLPKVQPEQPKKENKPEAKPQSKAIEDKPKDNKNNFKKKKKKHNNNRPQEKNGSN